ncbi:histidine kinase [Oxalobacteraceae bacterium CAVE-383]|nr:histidine kinase [Oxalobacteraceae bacterium CAVE-383]
MRLFALLFLALLMSVCHAAEPRRQDLSGRMAVLIDAGRKLTLAEAADPANAARFSALPGNLNLGFTDAAVWLRFDLQRGNGDGRQWWLEVRPSALDYATLYSPDGKGGYTARTSGDSLPFSQRDIAYQYPVFKLDLPQDRKQTFYLRLSGENPMSARLIVWQPGAFAEAIGDERLLYGLLFGMHLAMVLASLWFWQATGDATYASFAGFTLFGMASIAASTGMLQQYLLPDAPSWHDPVASLVQVLGLTFGVQFVMQFVEAWRYFPRLASKFRMGLWVYCGLAAATVALGHFKWFLPLFQLVTALCALLILVLVLVLVVHGQPRARYVLAGLALLSLSGLVKILTNIGALPLNVLTENSYRICMLVFLLVMNYAISRRYQELRREKESAQFALLTAARDAEHKLENLVAQRTGDLKQAMQQVEHALVLERVVQRQQHQFLATMSHEIRTPLAVIDAAAQNLERELNAHGTSAVALTRLEKIQQAALRLSSLFNDYAGDARFEGLAHGINLQWVTLETLLRDAADAGRTLANGHVFQVDPLTRFMQVCCDPDLMRLVLRTLADNAVKYSPAGTRIVFGGEGDSGNAGNGGNEGRGAGWTIYVRDEGPGIAAEEQSRIFEQYFRGRAAAQRPGTGLGLTLGRRLTEMQGGTLTVISRPGQGSTFRIWLPRPAGAAAAASFS